MKAESLSKLPVFATAHKMLGVFVPISEAFLAGRKARTPKARIPTFLERKYQKVRPEHAQEKPGHGMRRCQPGFFSISPMNLSLTGRKGGFLAFPFADFLFLAPKKSGCPGFLDFLRKRKALTNHT